MGAEFYNSCNWTRILYINLSPSPSPSMAGISLFIPNPENIYISRNTVVRYCTTAGTEDIGLIADIFPDSHSVLIWQFMTWMQVSTLLGEHLMHNVTFWPKDFEHYPIYLCDSDIYVTHSIDSITRIAFVFHNNDQVVTKLSGLVNKYLVSSIFNSSEKSIIHGPSLSPFPCTYFNGSLVSCFPSILFHELLGIKQKVHVVMNTWSMGARCIQYCIINNVDPLTWYYIQGILRVAASQRNSVQKQY